MTAPVDRRTLNRTLLQRQWLAERQDATPLQAVEHLVGLQSQAPDPPYLGLWTRLQEFAPHDLGRALVERAAVRITLQRGTIHLVTARDAVTLRPLLQSVVEVAARAAFGRRGGAAELDDVAAAGAQLFSSGAPLTLAEVAHSLAPRWPDADPAALSGVVRALVPLVQVPPRGLWRTPGPAAHLPLAGWLAGGTSPRPDLVDAGVLTDLTGGRATGSRLVDVAGAQLGDPDLPVPVRYLPPWDDVLLSHADRTRVMPERLKPAVFTVNGIVRGTVLVDGFVAATWSATEETDRTVLEVVLLQALTPGRRDEVVAEGERLLAFRSPGLRPVVELVSRP